jgi:hypothetical protein
MIYKLRAVKCKAFDVFFALWGEGGPNWRGELLNWSYDEEARWFLPKSSRKSYAQAVKCHTPKFPISGCE